MARRLTQKQIEKALLDPAAIFDQPAEVVHVDNLDDARKIEILRRWEYDAREIEVAEEEAMKPQRSSDLLDRVLRALHQLGAGPELERTPPTKHGGV